MPNLLLHSSLGDRHLSIDSSQSIREALDLTDLRVRAACGGVGSCGACVVHVLKGAVNALTLPEYQKLSAEQRATGIRLACQLRLLGDAEIALEQPARPSLWKSIAAENLQTFSSRLPNLSSHIYGLAVDLGTTHIRVSLWDRKHGRRIATRKGPNPQGIYGADVLNRLHAADSSPAKAEEQSRLARTAIIQAIRDILARDVGEIQPMLAEIGQVLIVGNTAMLALLSGHGASCLLDPEQWQRTIDCEPQDPVSWQAQWFMPHAHIELMAPVAGFVGSDLLADLLASGISESAEPAMLLDIGTNSEIALWDGKRFFVTSVPGGPAFEGVGIRHGMSAEPGAISKITMAESGIVYDTLGDQEPLGFCGSGLVDAIWVLRQTGALKPSGRFAEPVGSEGYALDATQACTAIFPSDVDALQRAKAATASAMDTLLKIAGLSWRDIERLTVCGAFGRQLNCNHAIDLGLLPALAADKITLFADASLAGVEQVLLHEQGSGLLSIQAEKITLINLSFVPEYDDCYIRHLRLQAIREET